MRHLLTKLLRGAIITLELFLANCCFFPQNKGEIL